MGKEQKDKGKKKAGLSWWQWILIIIVIMLILDLWGNSLDYENCVSKCVDDNYYCLDDDYEIYYDKDIITEYNAKMCHWELNDCELECRN